MNIDTAMIILFAFRAVMASLIIYFVGRYIDAHPPKKRFLFAFWKKDTRGRKLFIKYYWQIGVLLFIAQLIIAYSW